MQLRRVRGRVPEVPISAGWAVLGCPGKPGHKLNGYFPIFPFLIFRDKPKRQFFIFPPSCLWFVGASDATLECPKQGTGGFCNVWMDDPGESRESFVAVLPQSQHCSLHFLICLLNVDIREAAPRHLPTATGPSPSAISNEGIQGFDLLTIGRS